MPSLRTAVSTLGWAAYLACSWTWCIGMFLPVLLVRDYGLWGFVVFAVPNVLGAAAMGWVLARPGSSERLITHHTAACIAFSVVTLAFHFFWIAWLFAVGGRLALGLLAGAGLSMAAVMIFQKRAGLPAGAAGVLALSWIAAAVLAATGQLGFPDTDPGPMRADVASLAFVCVFGFALCPYLDLTFHHARAGAPGTPGTAAFIVGFGVFFASMLLFTLGYAQWMPTRRADPPAPVIPTVVGLALGSHVFVQTFFTVSAHLRTFKRFARPASIAPDAGPLPRAGRALAILFVAGWLVLIALGLAALFAPDYAGLSPGELIYRLFMSFYGLVFPAYVYLCMIPTRAERADGRPARPSRGKVRVWAFAVGVAAPMFWLGFIERETVWLVPGLLVVLLARFALPRTS